MTPVNVTTAGLPPANVYYFYQAPGGPDWDGILNGRDVQHDTMPWYVLGRVEADLA